MSRWKRRLAGVALVGWVVFLAVAAAGCGSSKKSGVITAEKSRNPATIRSGTGQEGFLGATGIGANAGATGTGKPEASTAHCTGAPGTIAEGAPNAATTRGRLKRISHHTATPKGMSSRLSVVKFL